MVALDVRAAGLQILTIGVEELADDRRLELCQAAANLQIGGWRLSRIRAPAPTAVDHQADDGL